VAPTVDFPYYCSHTIKPTMSKQPLTFLSLPLESRLDIYRHALVNKERMGGRFSRSMVQYQIMIDVRKSREEMTMTPALLRTTKQIYHEALPILYGENEFMVDKAKMILDWLQQIGPVSVTLLTSLRIFPHAVYSETGKGLFGVREDPNYTGPTWCALLNKLAADATGLRHVFVYLDAEPGSGHYGAGKDLNFVRALGKMKVSGSMKIEGFFGTEWPRYLEGKVGMSVWDEQSCSEDMLRLLRKYQRGTRNSIP